MSVEDRAAARKLARLRAICLALLALGATAVYGSAAHAWLPFAFVCLLLAFTAPWFLWTDLDGRPNTRKRDIGPDAERDAKLTEILLSGGEENRSPQKPPNVSKIKNGPKSGFR